MKVKNLVERPECLEKLCRWHHEEWSYLNPGRTLEQRILETSENLAGRDIPSTYIAEDDDGNVIGSASIVASDMPERPELFPWLASVYVDANHRKKGAGRAVVLKVMEHARKAGIATMYLYTPDREHFYRHMGWETIEKMKYHGADVTLMKINFEK